MSLAFDPASLRRGRLTYFPVVPGRVEFSIELRRLLNETNPAVVAVELPGMIRKDFLRAVERLPEMSVIVYPEAGGDDEEDERAIYVPVEPADPFTEAVRTANEIGAEVVFIEPDHGDRPHLPDVYPDTYTIRRIGLNRYIDEYRVSPQPRSDEIAEHAAGIAWKLQGLDPLAEAVVVISLNLLDPVLDAMEIPQEQPPAGVRGEHVQLMNLHPDCLAEVCVEYPYLQDRWEFYRLDMREPRLVDRPAVQFDLLREAEAKYAESTGEKLEYWHRRLIAKFARNLALCSAQLIPHAFDLAVAARSIADDNYGWEVWQMANRYPSQQAVCELETINVSAEEIWINTKRVKIRRRLPRPKQRLKSTGLKPRKKEKFPGDWARQTNGNSICSYPPEDLVVEGYGRFLKDKAKSILSAERERVEPFTTSILDGIDMRETIRNWHKKQIYVRKAEKLADDVGAVVVIFDEDPGDRCTYLTTWLGEHQNESDMAFYSTEPFDQLVGPGIGRAEYGGFLMVLPPRRMLDVWTDRDYDFAENKPERLLLAGLDYAVHRHVVYVASKPPRSIFRSIAAHLNRKIVYIPIGQLSPTKLKKVRVVHVLDSYDRRETAKDYLW
ncbi:MAG: hypothetical protein JSU00_06495 [Acidobacteria bacterium]|nr:hypothetical protein [Acidobacteriota bacterium]